MQVPVYNQEGKPIGEMTLSDEVFGVHSKSHVVHEAVLAFRANQRRSIASTKTRGEVQGGGKKPWKQKGTGRARQGSTRSPQWIGGGIAFGPTAERNFSKKINKKLKCQALLMALSDKLASSQLVILDSAPIFEPPQTKHTVQFLKKLPIGSTVLFVAAVSQPLLWRTMRNIPWVNYVTTDSLNLMDVLQYKSVIFMKDAVIAFEKRSLVTQ